MGPLCNPGTLALVGSINFVLKLKFEILIFKNFYPQKGQVQFFLVVVPSIPPK
jgi:hypothetical protein